MHIQHNNLEEYTVPQGKELYLLDRFDNCTGTKYIFVAANARLHYLAVIDQLSDLRINVVTQGSDATVYVYALLLGKVWSPLKVVIQADLQHDRTTAHLHLVSFLPDGAQVQLDGGVAIHPNVSKGSGHLLEENIILGEWVQIKTLPMLDVRSNDVSASHGARIEKLDAKKLFYAQSRGLTEEQAKWLLVHGYIRQCFDPFVAQSSDEQDIEALQEAIFHDLMRR
jgi:Fe-S cluster assembly scaffold protein SufB